MNNMDAMALKAELDAAPEWMRQCVAHRILGYKSDGVLTNLTKRGDIRSKREDGRKMVLTEDVKFYFELRVRRGHIV